MAKSVHNDVLDASLNLIKTNGTRLCVCEGAPASYAEATTAKGSGGKQLAIETIDSGDFTGPAEGDESGRKLTVNAAPGVAINASGNADHVAICDAVNERLLYVTETTTKALTAGDDVNNPAWDIEIEDPT